MEKLINLFQCQRKNRTLISEKLQKKDFSSTINEQCTQKQRKEKNNQNNESKQEEEEPQKELLIGGGAGCLSYLAGYMHALIEIVGKEKLREYKIGSVSAGSIVGLVLHIVLRQDKYDLKYFNQKWFRNCYEPGNKKYYGWFTCGEILREKSYQLMKLIDEFGIEPLDDNVYLSITQLNKYFIPKNKLVSQYNDHYDLGEALQSSCGIPYLINFGFFNKYRGTKTLDGGITSQIPAINENSKKVFINILPKSFLNFVISKPKNMEVLNITDKTNIRFPIDYWLQDENWADDMFLKGLLKAQQDIDLIKKAFQVE